MNQQKYKRRIWGVLLIGTGMLYLMTEKAHAQSSENYHIIKSAVNQGGAPSQSTNYQVTDAVGQSSVVGTASSENYSISSGIFAGNKYGATDVDENVNEFMPGEFKLNHNYPNPFNPTTTIEYHLPQVAEVSLIIYDLQGNAVRRLVQGTISAGYHTAIWNGTDAVGKAVASGVYFYRIEIKTTDKKRQSFVGVKKMILMK